MTQEKQEGIELKPVTDFAQKKEHELTDNQKASLDALQDLLVKVKKAESNKENLDTIYNEFILANAKNQELLEIAQQKLNAEALQKAIEELEAKWRQPTTPQVSVNVEDKDAFIQAFNDYAKDKGWKEGSYSAKRNDKGGIDISFPTEKDGVDFFKDLASQKQPFVVIDGKTNKVIAYSDGDGTLKTPPDGKEFSGDKLKPTNVDISDFKMPDPKKPQEDEPNKSSGLSGGLN